MDFNQLSKQPCIKDLSCSLCKNYLSYFPIHITVDKKNVCGRCELPEGTTCVRNEVYEILAKEVTFPCRYLNEGCIEKLSPKDMAAHEKQCHLRVVKCPASEFDSCTESFSLPEVTKHCTDKHSDLILKDGEFLIDLSTSESTKQLVIRDDDIFIFKKKFDSSSGILDCTIYSSLPYKQSKDLSTSESTKQLVTRHDNIFTKKFDSNSGILDSSLYSSLPYEQSKDLSTSESTKKLVTRDDNMFIFTKKFDSSSGILDSSLYSFLPSKQSKEYQIDLQNDSRTLIITGYVSHDIKNSKCNSICLNPLQDDKRNSMFITGTLTIKRQKKEEESKIQFSKELLKFMEAPVCSTCSKCLIPSSSVSVYSYDDKILCSVCKGGRYSNATLSCNFQNLIKELYFYCPNQKNGCTYMGRNASLQEHQLHCSYEKQCCIFTNRENCKWTDLRKHLITHINENHDKYVATSSLFTLQLSRNYNDNYSATSLRHVLKLSSYFFLLNFAVKNNWCYWAVEMISNFEKTFKYELEIVDTSGCQKLSVTQMCSALTDENKPDKGYVAKQPVNF